MQDLAEDEFWVEYENASDCHRRAMEARLEAQRVLRRSFNDQALEQWDDAHRTEDRCYEELKAAERVVWAKYKSSNAV